MPNASSLLPRAASHRAPRTILWRLLGLGALALLIWGTSGTAADKIDPAALKKVKAGTVHIKVTYADGDSAEGSGFVHRTKGAIITNAHVVQMLDNDSPKPAKIEVTFNSGEPNSQTVEAKVGYVDGESDLALLTVPVKDIKAYPELLQSELSQKLTETQDVFVVGFPLGKQAGPNVSVTATTVTSLRKDGNRLDRVQVGGGIHPGNSGGPIVDKDGKVVGIAVAGFVGTQVHLAIPTETLNAFLNGKVTNISFGVAYRDGDKIKVPIRFEKADPLNSMKTIAVETWIGKAGPGRPAASKLPDPLPDDSAVTTLEVKPDEKGVFAGEMVLDANRDPKLAYWQRYRIGRGGEDFRWYPGSMITARVGTPVDRKAATVKFAPELNKTDALAFTSDASFRIREAEGDDHTLSMVVKGTVKETVTDQTKNGWHKRVTYDNMDTTINMDKKPLPGAERLLKALKDINLFASEIDIAADGTVTRNLSDYSKVPQASRGPLEFASDQVTQSMDSLALPLPPKEVEPGATWKGKQNYELGALNNSFLAKSEVTYKYEGTFERNGRTLAVITFTGPLERVPVKKPKPKKGVKDKEPPPLSGQVEGKIEIFVDTGLIYYASEKVRAELELEFDGKQAKAVGVLNVTVIRNLAPTKK